MARLHVLKGDNNGRLFTIVQHENTPNGNNSVSVPWKDAALNSGTSGSSVMTEGTGAGQISTAELTNITAGDVYELVWQLDMTTAGTNNAQRVAALTAQADEQKTNFEGRMQASLQYFGHSQ